MANKRAMSFRRLPKQLKKLRRTGWLNLSCGASCLRGKGLYAYVYIYIHIIYIYRYVYIYNMYIYIDIRMRIDL